MATVEHSLTSGTKMPFSASAAKVLAALEMRGRESFASIAQTTKLSQQLVQYHVRSAEETGFIQAYNALIDVALLGYSLHMIYFRFLGLSSAGETKWIKVCTGLPQLMVISRAFGRWDATVAAVTADNFELSELMRSLSQPLAGKISEMSITTRTSVCYSSVDLLAKSKRVLACSREHRGSPIPIDQTDLTLLHILSKDGRASAVSLSQQVGLSAPAVTQRIARLESCGIIMGYRAAYRYEDLGYGHYRLFFKLANTSPEIIGRIRSELFDAGITTIASVHLGFADLDCRCWAGSLETLYTVVRHIQDKFVDQIVQIDVVPILKWRYLNHLPIPKTLAT